MSSRRVGDWIKFHCGDRVFDAADPRHVGRVEAITSGGICATIKWLETGWLSVDVPTSKLRRVQCEVG